MSLPKITVTVDPSKAKQKSKEDRLAGVKRIIAVGSGKGGVGKSTVAVNLAYALRRLGAKVGLLDADFYGPSIPTMLNLKNIKPQVNEQRKIIPPERYGITVFSMGFLIKEGDALIWRGPLLGKAVTQFLEDVDWGELDFMVIDLPPGTGDIQLSLTQMIPISTGIVVTTPQDVAFSDVIRAAKMFEVTKVPLLGVIENMAYFKCPQCGAVHRIFGESKIKEKAEEYDIRYLMELPLEPQVSIAGDKGEPIILAEPESDVSKKYMELAELIGVEVQPRQIG